jgi:hypothetical protein
LNIASASARSPARANPYASTASNITSSPASADFTAWSGPWGITYAINLTPDQNTGIGIWTDDMFVKALKTGRHMGAARPILPPMPWQAFRNLTEDDLRSIFAYPRTIPAVHNRVPEPVPPTGVVTSHN